ncbi:MAG: TniQ family protein [Scytonematopsis contorta HA4267-MV1]|jgi:DNA-binding XRE family transcriptional regulator|nr:TniQ family protein [Scytonematopsis contorta HA4267-MV1]
MENDLLIYDKWDLTPPDILPRSTLHSLAPIGVGSSDVESLTSYVARLADSHQVTTGILLIYQIAPLISLLLPHQSNIDTKIIFSKLIDRNSGAANGVGLIASSLLLAIEQLTFRPELKFLTLLSWSGILHDRGLLRPHSAWCPMCYEEWKEKNLTIYEPLIWKFKIITTCSHHQVFLSSKCPHCQQIISHLSSRSKPGYCSKCHQWLGTLHLSQENMTPDELTWQVFVTNNVGSVLASTPYLLKIPYKQDIFQNLKRCIDLTTSGNKQAFAKLINSAKQTIFNWYEGNSFPQILALLKICYCLNISLFNLLTSNIYDIDIHNINDLNPTQCSKMNHYLPFDEIKALLLDYVDKSPPIPMEKVAQEVGQNIRDLYRFFPEICRSIAIKSKKYRHYLSEKKIETLYEQAKSAAIELANLGIYPSDSKVQNHLNWKGHMKNKKIRDYLAQVRRELGFDK